MTDNNILKNNELNMEELEMVTGGGLPSWLVDIVSEVIPVIYHYEPQDPEPVMQETIIIPDPNVIDRSNIGMQ